ncbi:exocyst complex component EXO70A1-like protein [Carex littledalei]|uniref:Exocyst subunit Exo70 family protein n=1 Tax=Carex littledalei TaxID=544730 RepID=A0A833RKR2_9POAL|nr:exocyst complex component EXO70A1-like protein [Carex littledalei]
MDALKEKANLLRKSLVTTEKMVAAFNTFDRRRSTLDAAIRPIQVPAIARGHENVSKSLKKTKIIISQFDRLRETEVVIFKGPSENLDGFIEAMDQLLRILQFFNSRKSYKTSESTLLHVNSLLDDAAKMAETEFNKMLIALSKPVDPMSSFKCLPSKANAHAVLTTDIDNSSNSSRRDELETNISQEAPAYILLTLISSRYIPQLHNLAVRLVLAGHHIDARANALQQSLYGLGVQKIGTDELQKMQWESIQAKFPTWIDLMRIINYCKFANFIFVKLLFAGRKLCDEVLQRIEKPFLDRCFVEATSSSLATLLSFGEAVVKIKKTPDKLYMLLDVYETMCELQPEAMFVSNEHNKIMQWFFVRTRLVTVSAEILLGFRELIVKDPTTNLFPDGGVHPLSRYTMNYLKFLLDHQAALTQILLEYKTGDQEEGLQFGPIILRILQALQSSVEAKSKHYKDQGQSHLFLVNNIHYMVTSVHKTEAAKELLGDDWTQRQRRVVQLNANQYRRLSWAKFLIKTML